ncbi:MULTISPECIES: ABC transporter permease [Romboutsia]|uniref:ABC transporter, permease protein n=1 Tax=Romboutsia hominis TaxID=1507512 RepID=A0A2P2BQP8_9FIRM|nr:MULTISPECIES: ABC transporter permease [Romboutsia]MCH1960006.1 ABC transporter permease [Romboutsia hominis]MCH1969566.1 ABC transporter permease [Romboutsia hominis]CEI72665.1 ABC transporter, permease protein [Romboutsia hominis]
MKNDLEIVFKYIKSYKSRSLAIVLSVVLASALIVGVGTLSRSAQQADLDRLKRETGKYHAYFKDINKDQLKTVKNGRDIKDLGITSYYASSDVGEKLPINILYSDKNYLNSDTELLKGRFPKGNNEVVVEEWILNSMGLEPKLNQEITFKLYNKEKPETFKVVGILKDRYKDKSVGRCEMFLGLDENKLNNFTAHVEFNENSDISKNISNIIKEAKIDKEKQAGINSMLVDSARNNGRLDSESKNTSIVLSLFAGLVIYSIYTTSIYQRIREYGVLRAIGATNLKVFLLMLYELLILSVVSIPIGIILGIGGAQLFNKFAGNIEFEGPVKETPFVIPTQVILLSIVCILLVMFVISILTYIKIRRISPIEAIRRNFNKDKIKRSNFIISRLSKNISPTKNISLKNIFRNKKAFIMIMFSMSIGGIMIIKTDYSLTGSKERNENNYKKLYWQGDFMLSVNGSIDEENGLKDEDVKDIKNINGIDKVQTAKILNSRMPIKKDDILNMKFYESQSKGGYVGKVLNGLLIEDKENNGYLLKQKLKGYNDEMLDELNNHIVSGEINKEKMKKENLAVVYIPHAYEPYKDYKDYYDVGDSTYGKPIVDIKVGDTVKVKYPKGKIDTQKYWQGKDNYEYDEYEFKVGAIVDYPYADDSMYSGENGVDVIISDNQFKNITNLDNYDLVYATIKDGADHESINKQLGKIGSKVPGTTTIDMIKDKEDDAKMNEKFLIYNYGIVAVLFVISMFNIINNVSYNLTSRTSEFGMLRAVGISDKDFKNMIVYEGILYGLFSSAIVIVLGILLQIRMYKRLGFEIIGIEFAIDYKLYLLIIAVNIVIGLLATYLPARKIKETNIVDAINIIE